MKLDTRAEVRIDFLFPAKKHSSLRTWLSENLGVGNHFLCSVDEVDFRSSGLDGWLPSVVGGMGFK